jgi:hypothetical protein
MSTPLGTKVRHEGSPDSQDLDQKRLSIKYCLMRAAVPAAPGEAILVPADKREGSKQEETNHEPALAVVLQVAALEPAVADRTDCTLYPGARISGLILPS